MKAVGLDEPLFIRSASGAYIETEDGLKLVVVVFTTGHAKQQQILPAITEKLVRGVRTVGKQPAG